MSPTSRPTPVSVGNLGFDEACEILERLLPAEMASLGRNHVGHSLLHDVAADAGPCGRSPRGRYPPSRARRCALCLTGLNSVAADASGHVYACDGVTYRVQRFDSDGRFLAQWGGPGTNDDEYFVPGGLSTGAGGYVYVVEDSNRRIQKLVCP